MILVVQLAIDAAGNAYISGYTASIDYPTTPGAYDSTYLAGNDAFVTKLNPDGSALVYSTFIRGSSSDGGFSNSNRCRWECVYNGIYCFYRLSYNTECLSDCLW